MRAVVSYAAGILTLLMILASGGAWSLTDETRLRPVQLNAFHAEFAYSADLVTPTPPLVRALPPGCVLAYPDAACAVTAVAGGLDVPFDAYDLVPEAIDSVADWRPLVATYFEPQHVARALRVIACESRGQPDAKNPISTASGLFQHLASLWPKRSADAGWPDSDVFDPVANVAVAAWLVYEGGGWAHWYPSGGCWR
ncbi:MAG TPA: transglycosylase SLT domain-containing protein [Acidimicrobiia bacterium]|nr:transglycosylase SLT domain-containing protein [Acidimicrobiia bacterium]